jgi:hypothetical protein
MLTNSLRQATSGASPGSGIRARIVELACVLVCSFVVGCGEGFLQGLIVFRGFREAGFSGLAVAGDAGASVGGMSAAILGPILYFALLRERINLHIVISLVVLTLVAGLVVASLISWLSAPATLVVLVFESAHFGSDQ